MVTITEIIISETGKRVNNVIDLKEVNEIIKKSELNNYREEIRTQYEQNVNINLIFKENESSIHRM